MQGTWRVDGADTADWTPDQKTDAYQAINLLGGKDVTGKVIPDQCFKDLDAVDEPDAGKKPVVDAGPSMDGGAKGTTKEEAPKWPDPNQDESDNDDSPSAAAEPEDAGAKKKAAAKPEAGGCDVARSSANNVGPGLFLLVALLFLRRRSVR